MLEQQYARMRPTFEISWDPIWKAIDSQERVNLLKSACLVAADEAIRPEVAELSDDYWRSVLETLEAEIAILVRRLGGSAGT